MPRDYKNRTYRRNASRQQEQSGIPVWKWILVFIIVAGFISCLLWLKSTATSNKKQQPVAVVKPKKKPIQYEFYNVLPEREIIIPEYQIETQKRLERQQKKSKQKSKLPAASYIIQAGAFEVYREADKRKAQLLLLGQDAFLEKAVTKGKTWHRVKIGPFTSLNTADDVRKRLKEQEIESVIMKLKS
ncbi:MAG TPA: SPOR domain-containing protein [Crenotrichaceae bacterium]|nr:SPOR domain-containing protein [Crenotrichaceae bacterium]